MVATLRPGSWSSRRDSDTLQVGIDRRALLPDTAETRAVLARLEEGLPHADLGPAAAAVTDVLERHDLLVDDAAVRRGPVAVHATHGADGRRRLLAREAASVSVRVLGADPHGLAVLARHALRDAAVGEAPAHDTSATVVLLISSGEPDRELLDALAVVGQPHLVITIHEGAARLGPFVVPGSTACLRCIDAQLQVDDVRRGVVLSQLVGRESPIDLATAYAALGLGVRDVLAYLDGDRPTTWSSTLTLGAATPEHGLVPRAWRRHPHCGCCWDELVGT